MKFFTLLLIGLVVSFAAGAQTVNRQATVGWSAPTVCADGTPLTNCVILGYSVQKRINNVWTEIGTTTANVLTYTERNVALGTHTYRILATSAAGPSAPSNEVSKTFAVPGVPGNVVISVTITIE